MLQSLILVALNLAALNVQPAAETGFETALDAARDRLTAIEAPHLLGALDSAGCTSMGSFDLGEASMSSGETVTLHAQSMGVLVFARCEGERGVSLLRTVRVEKVVDGETTSVLSSESRRLDPSDSAIAIERRGRAETGPAPYAMAWRDEDGRQYVVTAFDQNNRADARRTLEPLIAGLSRSLDQYRHHLGYESV